MTNSINYSLAVLADQYHLREIYSFGSRAHEAYQLTQTNHFPKAEASSSDLDIGVRAGSRSLSVRDKVALANKLEELFRVPRIDLVVTQEADPFLAKEIICGERLFERDTYEADEYQLYILRRAGDLMPLEKERMKLILAKSHNV